MNHDNDPKRVKVTVDFEPATFDQETGQIHWKRLMGTITFSIHDSWNYWRDNSTIEVDGKTIRFDRPVRKATRLVLGLR
jgi:hypothetical protein